MGFVQGGESFSFQIKFEPTLQLLLQCKKYAHSLHFPAKFNPLQSPPETFFRYLKHRDDLVRAAAAAAAEAQGQDAEAAAAAADPSSLQWAHIAHEIQVPLQLDVRAARALDLFFVLVLFWFCFVCFARRVVAGAIFVVS
jgi:hypothetical protein